MLLVVAATEPELVGAQGVDDVELLASGIGPVDAAAHVAARLAQADAPALDGILHVGIAGCRRSSAFGIGKVVIGTSSVYCDTASKLVVREVLPDQQLFLRTCETLPDAAVAAIGTSADVGGSTGCDVEAMEGFGVLRAAQIAGVPALEVRVVSNHIEEEDRALWQFDQALAGLTDALRTLLPALTSTLG